MKHFTKTQKAIVDAYLAAKFSGKWDEDCAIKTPADLRKALVEGKVNKTVMEEIELRFTSITSMILASNTMFNHLSNSYKAGIRQGFRILFNNLKID